MSFRRKEFYLFLVFALFLSSCVPPPPTATADAPTTNASVTLDERCLAKDDDFHTYVAKNGNYCFLYPSGYVAESRGDSVSLTHTFTMDSASVPIENAENMGDVEQAISDGGGTLLIHYEDGASNKELSELIDTRYADFHCPWSLGNGGGRLVKTFDGNMFSYTIHAIRGDYYYQLNFSSTTGLSGSLEELFFTVVSTFTFLR